SAASAFLYLSVTLYAARGRARRRHTARSGGRLRRNRADARSYRAARPYTTPNRPRRAPRPMEASHDRRSHTHGHDGRTLDDATCPRRGYHARVEHAKRSAVDGACLWQSHAGDDAARLQRLAESPRAATADGARHAL